MIEGIDTAGKRVPLWFTDAKVPHFPKLEHNLHTEVCIIGGGITGLTTAYLLCNEGRNVVLLDDGEILSGETGRTTGHLCNALDDHYFELEKIHGKRGAKMAAESHAFAIDLIEKIIKRENIVCDFKRVNGYLFLDPQDTIATLEKERDAATRAGIKVELLNNGNINEFKMGPCLRFYNQAKIHPLKYLGPLAQAIVKKGGKIFSLTHASDIKPGKKIKITTSEGYTVTTDNAVIATNAPVFDKAMLFSKQQANRTYVIGFAIQDKNLEDALFWDTCVPYHYLRFQQIDNQTIISIGGEDHRTGIEVNMKKIHDKLEKWARNTVPHLGEAHYYWSGEILEPIDHLAYIGIDPTEQKNIFVSTGDSGNGLTHGTIAAMILSDQIQGRENRWEELYNPKRKLEKKSEKHKSAKSSKDTLPSLESFDEKKLKPGEGTVIEDNERKIAIYKDETGKLHYRTAVCPHLQGTLHWNSLEKSWDCPWHGSRFTPLGKVMDGPANKDLEKETKPIKEKETF